MSLLDEIRAWRKAQNESDLPPASARAQQHIDNIFEVATPEIKKALFELDSLIAVPSPTNADRAIFLADQVCAWCQEQKKLPPKEGATYLTGQALYAKVQEIFNHPVPPKAA
jgi:hypothetical protein